MSKIKVGQIYKGSEGIYVVTYIWSSVTDNEEYFCSIDTNGIADGFTLVRLAEGNHKLIAEYPTWQEAVNSKEFNNVAED
jgi:hypothetical protein